VSCLWGWEKCLWCTPRHGRNSLKSGAAQAGKERGHPKQSSFCDESISNCTGLKGSCLEYSDMQWRQSCAASEDGLNLEVQRRGNEKKKNASPCWGKLLYEMKNKILFPWPLFQLRHTHTHAHAQENAHMHKNTHTRT